MWKALLEQLRFLFTFTVGERRGVILLTALLLLALVAVQTMPYWLRPRPRAAWLPDPQFTATWVEQQEQRYRDRSKAYRDNEHERGHWMSDTADATNAGAAVLFAFNPNTFTEDDASRLGLSQRQIRNIFNYRGHGGVFRKKGDFARLYAMDAATYQRLQPYLQLPDAAAGREKFAHEFRFRSDSFPHFPLRRREVIELNTADSASLVALRGIGPSTAARIIRYRNRVGGFFTLEQLTEVWGISDSLVAILQPQLRVDSLQVHKLAVNTVTYDELKNHPYLRYHMARAIIAYREQHGPYRSLADMSRVAVLPDTTLTRLARYVAF